MKSPGFVSAVLAAGLLACSGGAGTPEPASASHLPIRLFTHSDTAMSMLDMLYVTSPWQAGEFMALDFPEHCWGRNFSGVSSDSRDGQPHPSRWQFSADSTRAWFEFTARDGNLFRASATVDSMAVRLTIEIVNTTRQPIEGIRVLVCTRPHRMAAFADTAFELTSVPVDGNRVRFGRETTMEGDPPKVLPPLLVMNVEGGPDNRLLDDLGWFSADWGRSKVRMVKEVGWPPVIGIHARTDENRWLATIWDPSRVMFSNPKIPCIHSDPVPPDCPPGETTRADGAVLFHEGDFASLVDLARSWRRRFTGSN